MNEEMTNQCKSRVPESDCFATARNDGLREAKEVAVLSKNIYFSILPSSLRGMK